MLRRSIISHILISRVNTPKPNNIFFPFENGFWRDIDVALGVAVGSASSSPVSPVSSLSASLLSSLSSDDGTDDSASPSVVSSPPPSSLPEGRSVPSSSKDTVPVLFAVILIDSIYNQNY